MIKHMATPTLLLIDALRKTAQNLANDKPYEWGHMGNCNCGNLAQVLLNISKTEIHKYAMERPGDWSEQLNDYCPTSGLHMDQLIFSLLQKGLSSQDLHELEYLKNKDVLAKLGKAHLQHNKREDVIAYLRAWADMLDEQLMNTLPMPAYKVMNSKELLQHI
jgi:hypothetical protein